MGGLGGKPKPGGAQTVRLGLGAIQVQPVFTSVVSVTPGEIVAVSPEETSRDGNWTSCSRCAALADDDIAPGPDGDAQAPIPNPPNTTNKVHARLNTFDMLHL
jgi:hypothetical protein